MVANSGRGVSLQERATERNLSGKSKNDSFEDAQLTEPIGQNSRGGDVCSSSAGHWCFQVVDLSLLKSLLFRSGLSRLPEVTRGSVENREDSVKSRKSLGKISAACALPYTDREAITPLD